MNFKVVLTKSGYPNFDPGGLSEINWRSIGRSGSDSIKSLRKNTVSDPSKVSTNNYIKNQIQASFLEMTQI